MFAGSHQGQRLGSEQLGRETEPWALLGPQWAGGLHSLSMTSPARLNQGLAKTLPAPGRRPVGPDRTGVRAGVGEDETLHDRARLGLHWGLEGEAKLLKDAGSRRRTAQLNKQNKTMLW